MLGWQGESRSERHQLASSAGAATTQNCVYLEIVGDRGVPTEAIKYDCSCGRIPDHDLLKTGVVIRYQANGARFHGVVKPPAYPTRIRGGPTRVEAANRHLPHLLHSHINLRDRVSEGFDLMQ